jgi:hypothetical protein
MRSRADEILDLAESTLRLGQDAKSMHQVECKAAGSGEVVHSFGKGPPDF